MKYIRPALALFLFLTLLTGVVYPLLTTTVGSVLFNSKTQGSLIYQNEKLIGSELIGQNFSSMKYFWGRPSATQPEPCNSMASGGSNLGPLNPALIKIVRDRVHALKKVDPLNEMSIPVDLVTASGSGIDPHISLAAALYQANRVARARSISSEKVESLVARYLEPQQLGIIGHARINVLKLNMALDQKGSHDN